MWTDSLYQLRSGKSIAVNFDTADHTQTTLLANIGRTHELSTHHYCEYLLTLRDRVTRVAVLIHNENRWQATSIKSYYPDLVVVLDRENQLLKKLSTLHHDKEYSTELLAKRWNFQAVFRGDTVDVLYDIPVEGRYDYVKGKINRDLIKDLARDYGHWGVKLLNAIFSQKEQTIIDAQRVGLLRKQYFQLFQYAGLWPNKQLENLKRIHKT